MADELEPVWTGEGGGGGGQHTILIMGRCAMFKMAGRLTINSIWWSGARPHFYEIVYRCQNVPGVGLDKKTL